MPASSPASGAGRSRRRPPALRLAREAAANWLARPLLTGGLAVLLAGALLSVTVAESNAVTDVRRYEDELVATGFATLFVQPGPQALTGLTTSDCDAIGALRGVRSSFALVGQSTSRRWVSGGPTVPTITATGNVVDYFRLVEPVQMRRWKTGQAFVDPDSSTASPATGEYLLRLAETGSVVGPSAGVDAAAPATDARAISVAALAMPLTSLGTGSIGSTLLVSHTTGAVQSCVLFVDLEARPAVAAAVDTALPAASGFSNQWALPGADNLDTPRARFEQRPSQYYWLGCVIVFTLFWAFQLRIRRSDHALYAIVGLRTTSTATMIIIELIITLAAATVAAAFVVALATSHHDGTYDSLSIGIESARRALLGSAICAAAWSWQHAQRTTNSTLNALKDR